MWDLTTIQLTNQAAESLIREKKPERHAITSHERKREQMRLGALSGSDDVRLIATLTIAAHQQNQPFGDQIDLTQ